MRARSCFGLCVVSLAISCNPGAFDKAVEKAPVNSLRQPDGYRAPDLGRVVLPLVPPAASPNIAARFMVAGSQHPGGVAIVDFDPAGKSTVSTLGGSLAGEHLSNPKAPVKSAALRNDGTIVLGTPNFGPDPGGSRIAHGKLLKLTLSTETGGGVVLGLESLSYPEEDQKLGVAVATGKVAGDDPEDIVVLSHTNLRLYQDGMVAMKPGTASVSNQSLTQPVTCSVELGDDLEEVYTFRALAIGDFVKGEGADEVAVGVPRTTSAGRVAIFKKNPAPAGGLICFGNLDPTGAMGTTYPRFGTALATGDLDGDGTPDILVVGSPPTAFVYQIPDGFKLSDKGFIVTPSVQELKPEGLAAGASAGDFGFRVGVMNLDGVGVPEIVVSAPTLTVAGKANAGRVYIFKGLPPYTQIATVEDKNPDDAARFGFSLSQVKFSCGGSERRLLVVGSIPEVFTYFRIPGVTTSDPRCFDM